MFTSKGMGWGGRISPRDGSWDAKLENHGISTILMIFRNLPYVYVYNIVYIYIHKSPISSTKWFAYFTLQLQLVLRSRFQKTWSAPDLFAHSAVIGACCKVGRDWPGKLTEALAAFVHVSTRD